MGRKIVPDSIARALLYAKAARDQEELELSIKKRTQQHSKAHKVFPPRRTERNLMISIRMYSRMIPSPSFKHLGSDYMYTTEKPLFDRLHTGKLKLSCPWRTNDVTERVAHKYVEQSEWVKSYGYLCFSATPFTRNEGIICR